MTIKLNNVGFIGLGQLGLPCAEVMASKYKVTGYDIYPRYGDAVKISETLGEAVVGQDVIFVAVQTPHDPIYDGSQPITHHSNKDFDYTLVKEVLTQINQYVTKDQLVVLISTVLPGTTRRELRECISNARFIYNPYLIAMGSVSWDMVNPEMVIIGTEDGSWSGDAKLLADFYEPLMENNPRFEIGTWDEAESIKIFYSTFISTKIGLVNMIQDVAMKNGNINVDVVTNALAESTMRIMGPKYMTAGMGDAGPCHPRDNIALRWLAEHLDLGYDIFNTVMHAREQQAKNLAIYLTELSKMHNLPIVIHGKAYKPDVAFCEGSYSLLVGSYIDGINYSYSDVLTHDHVADGTAAIILLAHNRNITYGYTGHDVEQSLYFTPGKGSVIVDPWRKFETNDVSIKVIHYGNTRLQP